MKIPKNTTVTHLDLGHICKFCKAPALELVFKYLPRGGGGGGGRGNLTKTQTATAGGARHLSTEHRRGGGVVPGWRSAADKKQWTCSTMPVMSSP